MANPLKDEDKLYERIKKENITIHPALWELISHHIRNDANAIACILGDLRFTPAWILKAASWTMNFLMKISFQKGEAIDLADRCDRSLARVENIGGFLAKLDKATHKDQENSSLCSQ